MPSSNDAGLEAEAVLNNVPGNSDAEEEEMSDVGSQYGDSIDPACAGSVECGDHEEQLQGKLDDVDVLHFLVDHHIHLPRLINAIYPPSPHRRYSNFALRTGD